MKTSVSGKLFYGVSRLGVLACMATLVACGGGGGGPGYTTSLTYTGNSGPATLNSSNAQTQATTTYSTSGSGVPVGVATSGSNTNRSRILGIANTVAQIARAPRTAMPVGASYTYNGTCPSNPGTLVENVDDAAGTGAFSFNDYCDDPVSGTTTGGLVTFSITPVPIPTANATVTFTMTMNLLIRENATGLVYKIDNYTVTLAMTLDSAGSVSAEDLAMSGRFYDPIDGYVDISMSPSFHYPSGSYYPTSGTMVITNGTQSVRMNVVSGGYTIEFNDGTTGWGTPTSYIW